jgi:hypothetical protein
LVPSAWTEHAPFAFWLVEASQPSRLVELGAHHGFSYLAFCQAVQRLRLGTQCFAVDTWEGDEHAGAYGPEVLQRLQEYHEPRYGAFSSLIRSTFEAALSHVEDGSVDLLHVDGRHRYEDARGDFEGWLPKLSRRAVVLFHDINVRQGDFGVARLWAELTDRYPSFSFTHGHGLGVLGVGERQAPAMASLFAADPTLTRGVRLAYSRLGSAVTAQAALAAREAALEASQAARVVVEGERDRLAQDRAAEARRMARLREELLAAKASGGRALLERQRDRAELDRLREEGEALRSSAAEVSAWARSQEEASARAKEAQAAAEAEVVRTRDAQAAAKAEVAHAREAQVAAESEVALLRQERAVILGSTTWRATYPIRAVIDRITGHRAATQLASRRAKRRISYRGALSRGRLWRDAALISRSPLFDAPWYLAVYADVGASGLVPARHYLQSGAAEGRDPGPRFSTSGYLRRYPDVAAAGLNPLVHFIRVGQSEGREPVLPSPGAMVSEVSGGQAPPPARVPAPQSAAPLAPGAGKPAPSTPAAMVQQRWPEIEPLPVFTVPGSPEAGRITIVTDSVNKGSLFGGVGTALILGRLLASERGCALRIVTRTEPAAVDGVGTALGALGVPLSGQVEFLHVPPGGGRRLDLREQDLFLTTSWWSTAATCAAVGHEKVVYLLQEDERLFYPHGDMHLRCAETLQRGAGRVVLNSSLLQAHFSSSGLASMAQRALVFEPAFPASLYRLDQARRAEVESGTPLNFMFYARPRHARNLYLRGLEAIAAALAEGYIDPRRWNFHFVGGEGQEVSLPRGAQVRHLPSLAWADYAALICRMDAGLSLMYTPHPSYPPLDLAAAGAVVVTNAYGVKQSLSRYSENILCTGTGIDELAAAIGDAARLATNWEARAGNYERMKLHRDWRAALKPVLAELLSRGDR